MLEVVMKAKMAVLELVEACLRRVRISCATFEINDTANTLRTKA